MSELIRGSQRIRVFRWRVFVRLWLKLAKDFGHSQFERKTDGGDGTNSERKNFCVSKGKNDEWIVKCEGAEREKSTAGTKNKQNNMKEGKMEHDRPSETVVSDPDLATGVRPKRRH